MAAADALAGRNVWLGIGKQSAVAVPAAPTKYFEVIDLGGVLQEYDYKKSERRVGSRWKGVGNKVSMRVPLSFKVECNPANIGLLLTMAMGADVAAADGAAYSHTITLANDLPYFTAVVFTDNVADNVADYTFHRIYNCKINSFTIDAITDDVITVSFEATGTNRDYGFVSKAISCDTVDKDATVTTASTTGLVAGQTVTGTGIPALATISSVTDATHFELSAAATESATNNTLTFALSATFPSAKPLYVKAEEGVAKLEIGADIGSLAQFDDANEFHLTFSNGLSPDRRIDNTATARGMREGDSEITGSIKGIYNVNTFVEIEAFQNGTERAIRFTATSTELAAVGKYFSMTITFDVAKYSGAPPSWDPDLISSDLQFDAEKTTSYPTVVIVNADATQYD